MRINTTGRPCSIKTVKELEQDRQAKIEALTADIKYCNEKISDAAFINAATPENLKALLQFRLMQLTEKQALINQ
jgi:hypothetical protein